MMVESAERLVIKTGRMIAPPGLTTCTEVLVNTPLCNQTKPFLILESKYQLVILSDFGSIYGYDKQINVNFKFGYILYPTTL